MSAAEASPDTSDLSLYQFDSCPFCARVRGIVAELGLDLELRDIQADAQHHEDLVEATGRPTVPVLRIEDGEGVRWLPESLHIARYLVERFASRA